jgi:hypothetical protein
MLRSCWCAVCVVLALNLLHLTVSPLNEIHAVSTNKFPELWALITPHVTRRC